MPYVIISITLFIWKAFKSKRLSTLTVWAPAGDGAPAARAAAGASGAGAAVDVVPLETRRRCPSGKTPP